MRTKFRSLRGHFCGAPRDPKTSDESCAGLIEPLTMLSKMSRFSCVIVKGVPQSGGRRELESQVPWVSKVSQLSQE